MYYPTLKLLYTHIISIDTVMDALGIQFEPSCFDIIFDKGTFDCILSSEVEPERKINSMLDVSLTR